MKLSWSEAFEHLAKLDGDEWDEENERLSEEWKQAYRSEFERVAVERGWDRWDAKSWLEAGDMIEESLIVAHQFDYSPHLAALFDVRELEKDINADS